jgi:ACS family hexuronate transporter-like MFS transporter
VACLLSLSDLQQQATRHGALIFLQQFQICFLKKAVGSVTGIGGMAGAFGGILIAWFAGLLFDHYKALGKIETGYYIMFIICGSAYLIAWLVMHFLVPKMQRVEV